jgi:hypothetical protein
MNRLTTAVVLAALTAIAAASLNAGVISSQTDPNPGATSVVDDGVINPGEYSTVYTGGGSGFGGTVGNAQLHLDTDGVNLYVGFQPGGNLNDNFVLHLDTRPGGFTDAQMNDTTDPGRNLLSNLTRDVDDVMPVLPDFGIVIGGFGQVSFELKEGELGFIGFESDQNGNSSTLAREFEIPWSVIGTPTSVNFFVSYGSDTNFMSNESMPIEAFNAAGNPGFDNGGAPVVRENYHQFNVPEPTSIALAALGAVLLSRRHRATRRADFAREI